MPRIIHKRHLIRIPVPADIAYDVTYYYNPEGDREISLKHVERLLVGTENQKGLAKHFLSSIQGKYELTIKQRLCLLQMEFPRDLRLKAIRACIEKPIRNLKPGFAPIPTLFIWRRERQSLERCGIWNVRGRFWRLWGSFPPRLIKSKVRGKLKPRGKPY